MGLRTIEQKINAAHNFDGTAPTGPVAHVNDLEATTAQNAGGLFDFGQIAPITVKQVQIVLGGQSAWSLAIVDVDNVEIPLQSGSVDVTIFSQPNLILLKGQKLKLRTTGASTAMRARITATTR
jgi:hypothetical protein